MVAQTTGAGIQGTLKNEAGDAVSKTTLSLRNMKTGGEWIITTDDSGRFRVPLLPPGEYDLRVSALDFANFGDTIVENIQLAVGQDAVINLAVSAEKSTGRSPGAVTVARINLTSGALSGLTDDKQIRDLPLNGRSFQQLALLHPGVTVALAAGKDVIGGRAPKISINGARPEQNVFLLDGTDINGVYDKTPGSVAGLLLGVEAVLEFQVLTNSFSAEFGRSAGGVVHAVTRSGENAIHGAAFEFLRNSRLDAKNFFDPGDQPTPAFKRNQYGGTVGGPIRRNRTFFFFAYEALTERLGITGVAPVPDVEARTGLLGGRRIEIHPAIPAYLDALFPLPNGRSLGGGVAEDLFSRSQPTEEHFVQGRIDHHFSAADTLFGRYTISSGSVDRQSANSPPIAFVKERSRNQYVTLEEQHIFSPTLLNILRLGFNRSTGEAANERTVAIPAALSFVPGEPFGFINILGLLPAMGGDFRLPRLDRLNNFQWSNTLILTRGAHGLRTGFMGQRIQFNQNSVSQKGGVMNFPNLESFLTGRPSSMDVALPGLVDPIRAYRQSLWGFFAQDDVRIRPNFTVNLGLRYEFVTVPTEANGKTSNLRYITDSRITVGNPWYRNSSLRNFAPRVGMAWDPFSNGRTSVRAGFGVFYDEIQAKYLFFAGSLNPPFTTRTSFPNPAFPNGVATFDPLTPIKAQLQTVNYDLQSPYIMQFNFTVQRSLPGSWDVSAAYAGSRGIHLLRIGETNMAPETVVGGVKFYQPLAGRRNPNFAGVTSRATDSQSFYNSLQLSAVKRFSSGLRAQASYTFARSVDDSSGVNSQDFDNGVQYSSDWYDRKRDRGLSSFFVKHNLVFNWTYDLPFGRSMRGPLGALLKGWQVNNVSTLQSGAPFTVRLGFNRSGNLNTASFSLNERPNLKAGHTGDPILGGPDRYWDIGAFELQAANTRGNLGRNTLIGPGLVGIDFSAVKMFALSERAHLQFRTEVFNIGNRPNFAVPSGTVAFSNANGDRAPNWGRITSTTTTSRQVQFGLKLTF